MSANKKIVITAVCFVVVVAAVVVVINRYTSPSAPPDEGGNNGLSSASMKAIKAVCQPTDFKETCDRSLSGAGNETDPKQLIKVALTATLRELSVAIKESEKLKQATSGPSVSDAYNLCHELLDDSLDDLHRTFNKFNGSDLSKLNIDNGFDLNIWLAGSLTCQETCLDSFEDTKGEASGKMKQLLKTSREMTSNMLSILDEFSKVNPALNSTGVNQRLLSSGGYPSWITEGKRRLLATPGMIKPDVVVAKDGSGKYKTINEALNEVPFHGTKSFVIYIKAGIYAEYVTIARHMTHVVLIGDGVTKTKITGDRSHAKGFKTFSTATVAVDGFFFMAKDLGIENAAGSVGHQAVALRSSSDMSIFYKCQIDGYQDTLYVHDHRQFYRECTITGTIDFIFGNAAALFQNCNIIVRKPDIGQSCVITAQGRTQLHSHTGIVLQNCYISGTSDLMEAKPRIRTFLGRPWKSYSRTIVLNSHIDSVIEPEGWSPWEGNNFLSSCWYAEYHNRGPGADLSRRVAWPCFKKINNPVEAAHFSPGKFLLGDAWIPASGVPYER